MKNLADIVNQRTEITGIIRRFFHERAYREVTTPILVKSPGMEPHLFPFETTLWDESGNRFSAALITSPEYSMKKLLGAGMQRIFTITPVFRNGEEFSGLHHPEFTMLEWYRQNADYHACMDETEALVKAVCPRFSTQPFLRCSLQHLFQKTLNVEVSHAQLSDLQSVCQTHDIHFQHDDTLSDLFHRLFLTCIEPTFTQPIFVFDYPSYQAALSYIGDNGMGQRFELYIDGLELCNGFTELTDAQQQRTRFEQEAKQRHVSKKTVYPIDEDLLALLPSVAHPTYGNALGVDRLHMLVSNTKNIQDVLPFPFSI